MKDIISLNLRPVTEKVAASSPYELQQLLEKEPIEDILYPGSIIQMKSTNSILMLIVDLQNKLHLLLLYGGGGGQILYSDIPRYKNKIGTTLPLLSGYIKSHITIIQLIHETSN